VYICGTPTDPNYTGSLFAVSPSAPAASSEVPKWIYTHFERCEATPAVGDNGYVYIVTDKSLRAINASNGALAWRVAAGNDSTESSPLFLKNKSVVVGTSQGLVSVYAGGNLAAGT
jgi:outer membrane protein assembly factor BamB